MNNQNQTAKEESTRMATEPRGQFRVHSLRFLILSALLIGLSGCELGRTMFQFSSGSSSPWVGIDLLPRKPKATKISHQKTMTSNDQELQSLSLKTPKESNKSQFNKRPLRLSLPSSKPLDQNDKKIVTELEEGSFPASSVIDF